MPASKKKQGKHGGPRANSGRPKKVDPNRYIQVTCVLRDDTVNALREGARSKFFGALLQWHLDRFPLPSYDEWTSVRTGAPVYRLIKRRRTPVIIAGRITPRFPRRLKPRTEAQLLRDKFRKEFVPA